MAQGLQQFVRNHPSQDWLLLQMDLSNAFNSLDRRALLDEVRQRVPMLFGWAQTCYAAHSRLYVQGHIMSSQQGVQQGDPLGPFLFALTWQRVVRQLPSELLLNVWYLDDGHLIGDPSHLASALDLVIREGAALGISLNAHKCKVWGPAPIPQVEGASELARLAAIPRIAWDQHQGIKVLGLPVDFPGSTTFSQGEILKAVQSLEEACHVLSHLGAPHEQHVLLRFCLDACRLLHFLRAVDCTASESILHQASSTLRKTLGDMLGNEALSEDEWHQSTLPLRLSGLGIKDPIDLLAVARVAGVVCFSQRAALFHFPPAATSTPLDFRTRLLEVQKWLGPVSEPCSTWLQNAAIINVQPEHTRQKWWSNQYFLSRSKALAVQAATRDKCRLQLQRMKHTNAFMLTVPNQGFRSAFTGPEYRLLLRWWLGKPLVPNASGCPCPCCGDAMDSFGDHLVTCKYNRPTQRHNAVRNAVAFVLRGHGVACRMEQQIGGKERPADIALDHFDPKGPLAIDLCIHHPLQPSAVRDPSTVLRSLANKEQRKVQKYAVLCESAGWQFSPLGFHPWGGMGPLGSALLNRLAKQVVGDCRGWLRMQKVAAFWHSISFALMRFVAQQLLPMLSVTPQTPLPRGERPTGGQPMQLMEAEPPVIQGRSLAAMPTSPMDMDEWEVEPAAEGFYRVGCLRVQLAPKRR